MKQRDNRRRVTAPRSLEQQFNFYSDLGRKGSRKISLYQWYTRDAQH